MAKHFFGITDKGRQRDKNEDTFIVEELRNKEFLVACVIDGVGGYAGGDIAAAIARTVILEHLQQLSTDIIQTLRDAVNAANNKIRDEKRKENKNEQMACVLTVAVTDVKNNCLYYAHVGDTRLYLLRDNSIIKLSKDHSAVGYLEDSGRLAEEDAMHHPMRNEINKALGFEENIISINDFIETGESPFLPGDIILLCSDGLTDMISSNTILSVLAKDKSLEARAHDLVNAANDAGGNDNITAVLVKNNKQPQSQKPFRPVQRKKEEGKIQLYIAKPPATKNSQARKEKIKSLLAFLSLLLLGILSVLVFQKNTNPKAVYIPAEHKAVITVIENKHASLDQYINDSVKKCTLDKKRDSVLFISNPVVISKDSFRLVGNGVIITCDSGYKNPAFIISNKSKYIVFDSLVLRNFDIGILLSKNNVLLKHVRFIHCRAPVAYEPAIADSIISGRFKDSIFISNSTLK